jgi:NAD(P)H-hydrate epimerase
MALADRLAIDSGLHGTQLMHAAGTAVAQAVMQHWSPRRVLVACGPGNNGGDGFVVARLLQQAGWPVQLALLGSVQSLRGDARHFAQQWSDPLLPLDSSLLANVDLVIDALFGAGLSRPLDGQALLFVQALANSHLPVCAIDVPSGLDGATGQVLGTAAQADLTVTFFRLKPGHVLFPGRSLCGRVVLADIGISNAVLSGVAPDTFLNQPEHWLDDYPWPALLGHKYQRGHALIVGAEQMTGASRLAARACARAGAGLVTVAVPQGVWPVYAMALCGIMVQPLADSDDLDPALADPRRNVVLLGPGAGVSGRTRSHVRQALASGRSLVLDADALSSFQGDTVPLLNALHSQCVVTPHDGEFARVFPDLTGSRLERARQAALSCGAVVVLKGPDTVVAWPNGYAFVNTNAPPYLATGGTGDVLAGFVAGLLAQGMPAGSAACAAVWLHGQCAKRFGPGLLAEDLPEVLPRVLRQLQGRAPARTR